MVIRRGKAEPQALGIPEGGDFGGVRPDHGRLASLEK
jgi:hypothetical protein